MRKLRISRSIAFLGVMAAVMFGLVGTASVGQTDDSSTSRFAHATVRDVNGNNLGTVNFFSNNGKIAVSGRLTGLAAGFHGFHVHAVGICDPKATDPAGNVVPFASAGPHLDAGGHTHGAHSGDLPSLLVTADGTVVTATATDRLSDALLFDADGSALIVHAAPDNFANIPTRYTAAGSTTPGPDAATLATGDSGGRTACGKFFRG
jgi:Cu-Zn family superoxide dismutase